MTDWEQHYVESFTPWDKGEPSPGLVDFLGRQSLQGRIVVPGCGMGHDVRAIAAGNPDAEVIGLDIAPTAVSRADGVSKVGGERFEVGDWFQTPEWLAGSCDWVWEHTCFCAIDPAWRNDYVDASVRVLKPEGKLLGVFYLDPYDEEHSEDSGEPPFGVKLAKLEEMFGSAYDILESWTPQNAYVGREGREQMLLMQKRS